MCAGAIVLARVPRVVYGARRSEGRDAAGSVLDVLGEPRLNHRPEVAGGLLAAESGGAAARVLRVSAGLKTALSGGDSQRGPRDPRAVDANIDLQGQDSRPPSHPDRIAARFAERQHELVTRRQLLGAGVSDKAIRHRLAVQRFMEVHPTVYSVAAKLSAKGRYLAAVLACGEGAVLSHRSAADLLGLRPTSSSILEITVPHGATRRPAGVRTHQTRSLHPDDTTTVDAIPTTTWPRTLADLAATLEPRQLGRALERAMILRLFDLNQVRAAIERSNGRRGIGKLRHLVEQLTPELSPTREELEKRFLELIDEHGLPRPRVNKEVEGLEVDFHWPDRRLIVETDGRETHDTPLAFERDRRRDLQLELAEWHVLRLTWRMVVHRPAEVAALLAARLNRVPVP